MSENRQEPLDGTFHFPPRLTTAAETIAFYSHVEVPEDTLERIWRAQNIEVEQRIRDAAEQYVETALPALRSEADRRFPPSRTKELEAAFAVNRAAYLEAETDRARARWLAENAARIRDLRLIESRDVRTFARYGRATIALSYSDVDPAQQTLLAEHSIEVAGTSLTVNGMACRFHLGGEAVREAFRMYHPPSEDVTLALQLLEAATADVGIQMANQIKALAEEVGEVRGLLRVVGELQTGMEITETPQGYSGRRRARRRRMARGPQIPTD